MSSSSQKKHPDSSFYSQNHHDCNPKNNSAHQIVPPELSSVFARIDPLENIHPFYTGSINSHSNQITHPDKMNQLPIERFEQILDLNDLNSIQL